MMFPARRSGAEVCHLPRVPIVDRGQLVWPPVAEGHLKKTHQADEPRRMDHIVPGKRPEKRYEYGGELKDKEQGGGQSYEKI